jgi:hypothetical protein
MLNWPGAGLAAGVATLALARMGSPLGDSGAGEARGLSVG